MRRIKAIGGPWPERLGLEGFDVTDEMNPSVYPRHGLGKNEVVISLDDDPLKSTRVDREHASSWTCVIYRADVEYL